MADISYNWPGTVWIFSDPHFGDNGILRYERTEFVDIDEANKKVISMINSQLQEKDTLVCLGDLGSDWENQITKIKKCAKKVLVMGNHDNDAKAKYRKYFDDVFSGPIFATKFVVLSHEPIPVSEHFINVHGHLHNAMLNDKRHINLAYKCNNYKLYNLETAHRIASNFPKIKAHFLEEWYAEKYVFINETGKFIPRNCFYYNDTGEILKNDYIETLYKIAGSMFFTNIFKEESVRFKTVSDYKKELIEFYKDPNNRNIEINFKNSSDESIAKKLFDNFVEKNNYQNDILICKDTMYGIIWFFTVFSSRLKDPIPALVKFKRVSNTGYRPERIICENECLKNKTVKLQNECWIIDDEYFDTLVCIDGCLENWDENREFFSFTHRNLSRLSGIPSPLFKGRLFNSEDEELALLEYETYLKQERP